MYGRRIVIAHGHWDGVALFHKLALRNKRMPYRAMRRDAQDALCIEAAVNVSRQLSA